MSKEHLNEAAAADSSIEAKPDYVELISRVSKLEVELEEEKNSFSHRFGIWAGLIAVAISIISGGIGVYDRVRSELEHTERQVQEAQGIARKLSELSLKLAEVRSEGDYKKLTELSGIVNIEILNLLSNLEALGDDVLQELQPGDLILFAEHSVGLGRQLRAVELAKLAAEKSDTDLLRAESAKQLSRALYADGKYRDIGQARAESEKAMTLLLASENVNRFNSAAGVLVSQAILEAYIGDCSASEAALVRMKEILSSLAETAVRAYVEQAKLGISQFSRC